MATVSAGSISLDSTISFTDDLSVSVATRNEGKVQTDVRRPNIFQHSEWINPGEFPPRKASKFSSIYNWGSQTYHDYRYLRQGYVTSNYVADDPHQANLGDRLDYELLYHGVSDTFTPEFDFAEFHSATISAYTLTFDWRSTSGTTWTSESFDQDDIAIGTMIDNYSGMLQVDFNSNNLVGSPVYVRNIRLSVTFTGITDIRGNRLPATTKTQGTTVNGSITYNNITLDDFSGTPGGSGFSPSRVISTLFEQEHYTSLPGGVFDPIQDMSFEVRKYTPSEPLATASVLTNTGTLDTVDVNQNGLDRSFGSDITRHQTQGTPSTYYYSYAQDYYPIIHTNVLDYPDITVDQANTSIYYDLVPSFDNTLDQVGGDIQFLYRMPTLADATLDAAFTADFSGGLRIDGSAQLDATITETLINNQIGVITPAVTRTLQVEFFPAGLPPYYELHHDPVDAGGNPIDYGNIVRRADLDLPDVDAAFTQASTANPRRISTATLSANWSQELQASAVGVIISNQETETFQFQIQAVVNVLRIPNRYRELLLMPDSRVFPAKPETRDYAVNTETRAYPVPEETRQRTVDQETRTQTEKGYT